MINEQIVNISGIGAWELVGCTAPIIWQQRILNYLVRIEESPGRSQDFLLTLGKKSFIIR